MSSFLDVKDGIFLPAQRFSFSNITTKPFASRWGGIPVVVGPGETIEISDHTPFMGVGMGHCLSVKFTKELVDNIFADKAKIIQNEGDSSHKPGDIVFNRPTVGMMAGVPEQRKIYEDQILKKLDIDEEDGSVKLLKKQMVDQLTANAERKEGVSYEPEKGFSEIPKGGFSEVPTTKPKAAKTKKIDDGA